MTASCISTKKLSLSDFFGLLRVKHWLKSIFILIGFFFSGQWLLHAASVSGAVLSFCLISSAVYIYNDLQDVMWDRNHPTKKFRPIASGRLNRWAGLQLFFFLSLVSLVIASFLSTRTIVVISSYLLINILYSHRLKHIVYVDVLCIASGFMLRILMGSWAIGIVPSKWLLICGTTLSLFLALSKRWLEYSSVQTSHEPWFRPVLKAYDPNKLIKLLFITAVTSFGCYAKYALYISTTLANGQWLVWSLPLVLSGFLRYGYRLATNHDCLCPIDLFIKDRVSIMVLLAYSAITTWVYF